MKNSLKQYELTFILGEKAGEAEGKAKTKELTEAIKKLEGTVSKEEAWGRRELAYPIKGNRSGYYVTLWFEAPSNALKALDHSLRFDESVIRSLVTQAYTSAQPGSLYPVVEEEKKEKGKPTEDATSGEEEVRRSRKAPKTEVAAEEKAEELPEEERLEKLDEALEELLKDEE